MERFVGLLGLLAILALAWGLSNNRKAINLRTVGWGLGLQFALAVFVLKTNVGKGLFQWLGRHSLMIYLLHQPVLAAIVAAIAAWCVM